MTPALDRLAKGATVFERALATAPWTVPSHASMFTGLYPSRHGAGVARDRLAPELSTLAEILHENGYFTAGVAGGLMAGSTYGFAQGFDLYHDPTGFELSGREVADLALSSLEDAHGEPTFLFVNFFDPHGPYQAPAHVEEAFGVPALTDDFPAGSVWRRFGEGDDRAWSEIQQGAGAGNERGLDLIRAKYLAEVCYMDRQLARLFSRLRRSRLYEDALIVIVADHGEFLGERGLFTHSYHLEPELVEIPLLIKWPGQQEARRDSRIVSQVDLFSTILGVAGITQRSDGRDLGNRRGAKSPRRDRIVFYEEHAAPIHFLDPRLKVADHLYGEEGELQRQVVWESGSRCAFRQGSEWEVAPCADPGSTLKRLVAILGGPLKGDWAADDLPEHEQRQLEALGYL